MIQFNKKWAIVTLLLSMVSIQCGAAIAKYLFHQVGPAGAVALRVGFAGVLLALVTRPKISRFGRREWLCVLFYGFSIGAMNLVYYYGIQRVPLGIGVAIEFTGPLGLALLMSRKPMDFLWAILAGIGILMIVPWRTGQGSLDPVGIALVAFAGVLWALYIVMANKIVGVLKGMEAVTCGMCVAALIVLPFGFGSGDLFHLSWPMLGLGVGVAILSSALPFSLDMLTVRKLPAKTFSVLQSLQPALGALSGLVFLGEKLTLMQWCALFCIMAASTGAALCAPEKK